MFLEFPSDPACEHLDRQYMLGESLLVAPVFREDGVVDYYLPEGVWTNLLDGSARVGGKWYRDQCDSSSCRCGSGRIRSCPWGRWTTSRSTTIVRA
jgi:alpha-glucosidase (family GH31 glycosyl hydrolase)